MSFLVFILQENASLPIAPKCSPPGLPCQLYITDAPQTTLHTLVPFLTPSSAYLEHLSSSPRRLHSLLSRTVLAFSSHHPRQGPHHWDNDALTHLLTSKLASPVTPEQGTTLHTSASIYIIPPVL